MSETKKQKKDKDIQQRRRVEYQHFSLKKFKVTETGVNITHEEIGADTGNIQTEGKNIPHPDLRTALDKLQLYMASRLGMLKGWDYSREHLKLKDEQILQGAVNGHAQAVASCKVGGLIFAGDNETYGVQITGSVKVDGGSYGLSVPKITFSKDVLGYEDQVQELCEDIKSEIYAYRFQHKKAQLDIETEAAKKKNPGLFAPEKEEKKEKSKK